MSLKISLVGRELFGLPNECRFLDKISFKESEGNC
jgi:hypothetical protein